MFMFVTAIIVVAIILILIFILIWNIGFYLECLLRDIHFYYRYLFFSNFYLCRADLLTSLSLSLKLTFIQI